MGIDGTDALHANLSTRLSGPYSQPILPPDFHDAQTPLTLVRRRAISTNQLAFVVSGILNERHAWPGFEEAVRTKNTTRRLSSRVTITLDLIGFHYPCMYKDHGYKMYHDNHLARGTESHS